MKKLLIYLGGLGVLAFGLCILLLPAILLGFLAPTKPAPSGPPPIGIYVQNNMLVFAATNDGCIFSVQIPTSKLTPEKK